MTKGITDYTYCGTLDNMCCIPIKGNVHNVFQINHIDIIIHGYLKDYDLMNIDKRDFEMLARKKRHICEITLSYNGDVKYKYKCSLMCNSDNTMLRIEELVHSVEHYKYYMSIINKHNSDCTLYVGNQGKICYAYFVDESDRICQDENIFDGNVNSDNTVSYNIYKNNSIKLMYLEHLQRKIQGGEANIKKYVILFILCMLILLCIVGVVMVIYGYGRKLKRNCVCDNSHIILR